MKTNKQTTAMQDLINFIDQCSWQVYKAHIKKKAIELLSKEKQQVVDAYWGGLNGFIGTFDEKENRISDTGAPEKYFNDTFEPNI